MSDVVPDPSNKPSSHRKKIGLKFILKLVLAGAAKAYSIYRVLAKLISFFKEWLD